MPLKIGVNALYLKPGAVGGTEVYLKNLLTAMAVVDSENSWTIFANNETPARDLLPGAPNFHWSAQPINATFRPGRIVYEQLILPSTARDMDVMLNPGFTAPVWGMKNVTVFHDLQHKRHPEYFRWYDLPFWDLLLWASARRSTRLISVSQTTHDDLQRYYRLPSTTIYHGVDAEFFKVAERRRPENLILCVSTLHPHKNHVRLIQAFAQFQKAHPGYHLALAGIRGFATADVEAEIARLGLADAITITGWISQQDLLDFYARAAAVIYPSTFEGFGMPVIESMAAQVPLACSNIEPLHTLVAGHAIEFDPLDVEAIADALAAVIREPLSVIAASAWASQFRWETTARATLDALKSA